LRALFSFIKRLASGDRATPGNYAAKWDFGGVYPEPVEGMGMAFAQLH